MTQWVPRIAAVILWLVALGLAVAAVRTSSTVRLIIALLVTGWGHGVWRRRPFAIRSLVILNIAMAVLVPGGLINPFRVLDAGPELAMQNDFIWRTIATGIAAGVAALAFAAILSRTPGDIVQPCDRTFASALHRRSWNRKAIIVGVVWLILVGALISGFLHAVQMVKEHQLRYPTTSAARASALVTKQKPERRWPENF